MIRSVLVMLSMLGLAISGHSQEDIAVGTWRTHNSFNSLISIANSDSKIYAASTYALFNYTAGTEETNSITSLTGLNDSDITVIGYNNFTEKLVIAYQNGNIDILEDNKIVNFPDLLVAGINSSKQVNHIYNYNNQAYLSTDFGVMVLDLTKTQVKDTFFELGPMGQHIEVYSSTISFDSLYIATEIGILRGGLKDNLKDFNQWQLFDSADGIPNIPIKVIISTPSGITTAIDSTGIFEYDGNSWFNTSLLTQSTFLHGSQNGPETLITTPDTVYVYSSGKVAPIQTTVGQQPVAALSFNNINWIADGRNGLVNTSVNKSISPNGPYNNEIVHLYNFNDNIIALSPAFDNNHQPLRNNDGYFVFTAGSWQNYNSTGYPSTTLTPKFDDITGVAYTSIDNTVYFSSFGYGIMAWDLQNSQFTILDESNSPLINYKPPGRNVLVSALASNTNELSVLNFESNLPLHTLKSEKWQSFNPTSPAKNATQLINTGNGIYWMKVSSSLGGGIKVYDTVNNRELYLTEVDTSGNLPDNYVLDMSLDREGKMWVATEKGVVYYHNAAFIFDFGQIDPVFPIFESQILFKNEKITALEIDGGNRIWMGTSSGLWLFDNDGQDEIVHFQADESPLPSNDILDLVINKQNGELFIATMKGLVSFRGSSTSAGKKEEVKIFPNPVITSTTDIVTIEGVPDNADVRITDSSGRLVYKTKANGNTAVWQGISSKGYTLSSGVFFVFIASEDGSETQVGKIAIIF